MQNNSDRHVEFIITDNIAGIIKKNNKNISIISSKHTANEIYKYIENFKFRPKKTRIQKIKKRAVKKRRVPKNKGGNSFLNILTFIATLRYFFIGE